MLLQSGKFRLKGKKALLNQEEIPVVTVMDVTETPIERPQTSKPSAAIPSAFCCDQ